MPIPYIDSKRTSLRKAGYDELWLQSLIHKEPSLLGLGDLISVGREVRQRSGGRLDLVLADPQADIRYEVEIMLGATDESHIIRTIEYWDIESRRYPLKEHRAVIVAEEITNRFFNVIGLLSRSIPIIAIKLDALEIDGKLALSFTKVLDLYESPEADDPISTATSAQSWVEYSNKESHEVFEKVVELLSSSGRKPRITYNADHIAVGGLSKNFAWFRPTRKNRHCTVDLRVGDANLDTVLQEFNTAGLDASQLSSNAVRVRLASADLSAKAAMIKRVLDYAVAEGGGI
jgi:hypothetical protein